MTAPAVPPGPNSQIDRIANRHVAMMAALDPIEATGMGVDGHDHELPDYSPQGHAARFELSRSTARALREAWEQAGSADRPQDRITFEAMQERLGLEQALFEAGEHLADLNVVASPIQQIRDVFDLMPTATAADWQTIAERLAAVPACLNSYAESLRAGQPTGPTPAVRQIELGADEARKLAGPDSAFRRLIATAGQNESGLGAGLLAELERAASAARAAYGELAEVLERELAPKAPTEDAFGRDRYALWSRYFVGAAVDLDEAYAWGEEELARVTAEQEALAVRIAGTAAGVPDAVRALDDDASRKIRGKAALREWMQTTADQAMAALDGTYFDIPEPVKRIEAMIAPSDSGAIYYTGPSQDFSRPGRMWWSVPEGVDEFATWREKSTVYHEGVPGHHLQIGIATAQAGELNDWRRLASWSSGYGEGWALYAEALMGEFGFMDDPGDRFGLLDAERLRAARVVFDIGVHLRLSAPARFGGGRWDADKAWALLEANVSGMSEGFARFEWARYLGWGGQAPSYKLGQREWNRLRADSTAGSDGSDDAAVRDFHNRALRLGSLPLAVLPSALGL
ncbi:MAG: DUF885 domain-containing protein [Bifidobacteriaceae bacterium]|jgi:uncharacterized protein (DUF885 family)|nr:DUF885 domain-containing protein [Bifidobacteriaceae bacterium]